MAAAMAMPCLHAAHAENAPERGLLGYKYLDYQDSQPGAERISVKAHSLLLMAPVAEQWSIQATATVDSVSGASPQMWTLSGASMHDKRRAADIALTRYFPLDTLTAGASLSDENDYTSKGLSLSGTHSSEDRNTTFTYGIGINEDHITSQGLDKQKKSLDLVLGLTRVLSPRDIAQVTLGHTRGHGFYTDPYKLADFRPGEKSQSTLLARWNHHFEATEGTLRLSYRYYVDTWDIHAHSLGLEYIQPLGSGWTLMPLARLHDQTAAAFFIEPAGGVSHRPPYRSLDQRLSAFGARSIGLKASKELDAAWTVDLKYEYYEQRGEWRLFGAGSTGLEPFRARIFQFGLSRKL